MLPQIHLFCSLIYPRMRKLFLLYYVGHTIRAPDSRQIVAQSLRFLKAARWQPKNVFPVRGRRLENYCSIATAAQVHARSMRQKFPIWPDNRQSNPNTLLLIPSAICWHRPAKAGRHSPSEYRPMRISRDSFRTGSNVQFPSCCKPRQSLFQPVDNLRPNGLRHRKSTFEVFGMKATAMIQALQHLKTPETRKWHCCHVVSPLPASTPTWHGWSGNVHSCGPGILQPISATAMSRRRLSTAGRKHKARETW